VIARESAAGSVGWYLADRQGSVIAVTDGAGAILDRLTYDAFGNTTSESAPASGDRYGFDGRERDIVTGQVYCRARYYDPALGKWVSMDPEGFSAGDANLYRYVGNNPTNATDPTGRYLFTESDAQQEWIDKIAGMGFDVSAEYVGSLWNRRVGIVVNDTGKAKRLMNGMSKEDFRYEILLALCSGPNFSIEGVSGGGYRHTQTTNEEYSQLRRVQREWECKHKPEQFMRPTISQMPSEMAERWKLREDQERDRETVRQVVYSPVLGLKHAAETAIDFPRVLYYELTGNPDGFHPISAEYEAYEAARKRGDLKAANEIARLNTLDAFSQLALAWLGGRTSMGGPLEGAALGRVEAAAESRLAIAASRPKLISLFRGPTCFVAGTPLLTPDGAKPIEEFRAGDLILSRAEADLYGLPDAKPVEEVFTRVAPTLRLTVSGRVIETTHEHPVYVIGKGWRCAKELERGDALASHNAETGVVEQVAESGGVVTVYNLRVADWHTYFVGCREWGFSVWAHNADYFVVKIEGTQTWTIVNEAGEVAQVAAGKMFGNPANAAKFAEEAGIENVRIHNQATWSAEGGLKGVPVQRAGAEVRIGTGHTDQIQTPQGPVEIKIYAGGYDPGSNRLGLDRHHQAGAAVLSGDAQVAIEGNWPGVTVYDFPSQKTLIWNNNSGALPTALTSGEQRAIQRGLEGAFQGRQVIFDNKDGGILRTYRGELSSGGAK
jgi:RHS repeat-associated protein